jgi:hypothetical protein
MLVEVGIRKFGVVWDFGIVDLGVDELDNAVDEVAEIFQLFAC